MKYLIPFAVLVIVLIFGSFQPLSAPLSKENQLNQEHLANETVNGITDCEQQSIGWIWICLEDLAKELYRTYSPQDIFAAIAAVEDEPVIFVYCHRLMHFWGREIYKQTQSIPEALKQASFVCEGASIHGIVEGYMMEQNWPEVTHEKLTEFVTTICQSIRATDNLHNPFYQYHLECLHGIGHALMFITGNDLPLSLELCNALPFKDNAYTCHTGVFMENHLGATSNNTAPPEHASDYLSRPDDPLYPCSILEEQYLPVCYQFKADLSLRTNEDFDKAIEVCLEVPSEYQSLCFYQIGKMAPDIFQEHDRVKAVCDKIYSLAGDLARLECIKGVISTITWKYSGEANKIDLFCNFFEKKEEERECRDLVTHSLNKLKKLIISQ